MKASEIAMIISGIILELEKSGEVLNKDHVAVKGDSNMITNAKAGLQSNMARYIYSNAIEAWAKKQREIAKDSLDDICELASIDAEPVVSETKVICTTSDFMYSKKQNRDGVSLTIKDFEIELQKLGVDPDKISKAKDQATKVKKGAVYVTVTGLD